jgi:hypothetical protein
MCDKYTSLEAFRPGQEVQEVLLHGGGTVMIGEDGVEKITVILECDGLWFGSWSGGGMIAKWNGRYVTGVAL